LNARHYEASLDHRPQTTDHRPQTTDHRPLLALLARV